MATTTTERARARRNGNRSVPDTPLQMGPRSWFGVLRRTVREFKADNLTDWAAALTYYGILAIFPALLALVSILGLFGQSATQPLIDNVGSVAPGSGDGERAATVVCSRSVRCFGAACAAQRRAGIVVAGWRRSVQAAGA